MRMLGVAVAVLAATGCVEEGVFLEVVTSDGVTEVELFVVDRSCMGSDTKFEPCDGLQPADFSAKVAGSIFIRDQDEGESWKASVDSGSAWFKFGVDRLGLQRVVAVGLEDGEPVQFAMLTDVDLSYSHKVIVTLDKVDPWEDANDAGDDPMVKLWADGRCLGLHHGEETLFIVTEGDADCDQIEGDECAPLVYLADEPRPSLCATDAGGQCVLGTSVCNERNPEPAMGCAPTQVPLDADICNECQGKGESCIEPAFERGYPRIECTFYYDPNVVNPGEACDGTANAPAHIGLPPNGEPYCAQDSRVASFGLPPGGFTPVFDEDADWVRLSVDTVRLPGEPDCHVKLYWNYLEDMAPPTAPTDRTLLFRSQRSSLPENHVMPLFIHFQPGCDLSVEPACTLLLEAPKP